jgi:Adenylate and Guanylate cyclase catalytic domain
MLINERVYLALWFLTALALLLPALVMIDVAPALRHSPLASAVTGRLYVVTLSVLFGATIVLFSARIRNEDWIYSMFRYTILIFCAGNLAMASTVTDRGPVMYLGLWAVAKSTGMLLVFHHIIIAAASPECALSSSQLFTTAGYALSCASLLCAFYSSLTPPALSELLQNIRSVCFPLWILLFVYSSAVNLQSPTFAIASPSEYLTLMKTLIGIMALAVYLFMSPGGVSKESNEIELVKVNFVIMLYIALFEVVGHKEEQLKLKMETNVILGKVFPVHIVDALSASQKCDPMMHRDATVFFSDISNFVGISEQIGPIETLKMLDVLFSLMDECVLQCPGMYKVETIGDCECTGSVIGRSALGSLPSCAPPAST